MPAADGLGPGGVQHTVEHGHADGGFRALAGQATRAQSWPDDRLVASHHRFDQRASAVAGFLLPAQSPVGLDRGNVLVALRRVVLGVLTEDRRYRRWMITAISSPWAATVS